MKVCKNCLELLELTEKQVEIIARLLNENVEKENMINVLMQDRISN